VDTIEEHAHETIHHHGHDNRVVALMIAALAAALAIAEMGEKQQVNSYVVHHISASDDWAFYQAKNIRASEQKSLATILTNLPNATDPGVQAAIKEARETEARLRDEPGDGMKQLIAKAKADEERRDEASHRYHQYEVVVSALQIAIVLASISVVTAVTAFAATAATIGAIAVLGGLLVAFI
jgi:hypothetical protein